MKDAQKTIIGLFLAAVILGGFWIFILSPKRTEATKAEAQVQKLTSELSTAQAEVAAAEQAKKAFPADFQQVLLLGKAVPASDDIGSLLVQIQRTSKDDVVDFRSLKLAESAVSAAPTTTAVVAATPTEAAAANLPIGATVGTAGLGVLPYTLGFTGGFFSVSDFLGALDNLVQTDPGHIVVDGRLLTVDGFSLEAGDAGLGATLAVNSFVTPPGQGITAGATSSAPAEVVVPAGATPAAAVVAP